MEAVDARRAWLEACFVSDENDKFKKHAAIEERNEKRMEGNTDWTGVVVERLFDQERHKELKASGVTVYSTDDAYLRTVAAS